MLKIYGCRWLDASEETAAFIFMEEDFYPIKLQGILTQKIAILVKYSFQLFTPLSYRKSYE